MADPQGFLKVKRKTCDYRPIEERVKDFKEVFLLKNKPQTSLQASRCMDCGTPFCHASCPLYNFIPDWNNEIYLNNWVKAYKLLELTNNFPEITGRVCPALCEFGCVLGFNDDPVTIRENELAIIEYAFKDGLVKPQKIKKTKNKKVAVIGAGPAGLAVSDELNKKGYEVIVFEKEKKVGGILRYGIPDFKLDKKVLDRRIDILKKEGINFKTQVEIGKDYSFEKLRKDFDAVCLTIGSKVPRDLNIEGRSLNGIYFAMDYLTQANKIISGEIKKDEPIIDACGKKVLVIGGGDTGADCVGVANRQKALSIKQIEILPRPPLTRTKDYPWPKYPVLFKTSSSHEEGCERMWSILTKKFVGDSDNKVKGVICSKVEYVFDNDKRCSVMKEIEGSEFFIEADIIILALGFLNPDLNNICSSCVLKLDERKNIVVDGNYMTSIKGVFAAGDAKRGPSLVVWAIAEGRQMAISIDKYLSSI